MPVWPCSARPPGVLRSRFGEAMRCYAVLCGAMRCYAVLCGAMRAGGNSCPPTACNGLMRSGVYNMVGG